MTKLHGRYTRWLLTALVAALPAAACAPAENMLLPGGPAAAAISRLAWIVLGVFTVASVVMWLLVFWVARRRRGTLANHLPWNAGSDRRWITVGGLAVPAVAFVTIFILMLRTMGAVPVPHGEMASSHADVRVVGHQWWWEVEYVGADPSQQLVTANEIHIPVGRPVDIDLGSRDVIHSFWVPRLHGKVDLVPGVATHIRIQADEPGVYPGQCGEYCGPQHAHMVMLVVADAPDDYARWLERSRAAAIVPTNAEAIAGQRVFMQHECALCHTVRGTTAQGTVGPDLTHFGSRRGLAANSQPNTRGPLSAWVTHAQSLKPYAQMPNLSVLSGEESQALVTYLESLQ